MADRPGTSRHFDVAAGVPPGNGDQQRAAAPAHGQSRNLCRTLAVRVLLITIGGRTCDRHRALPNLCDAIDAKDPDGAITMEQLIAQPGGHVFEKTFKGRIEETREYMRKLPFDINEVVHGYTDRLGMKLKVIWPDGMSPKSKQWSEAIQISLTPGDMLDDLMQATRLHQVQDCEKEQCEECNAKRPEWFRKVQLQTFPR